MGKKLLFTNLFLSVLGTFLSISAFVVFFIYYHNLVAGTWTILSGVFAAASFQLHFLYWRRTLSNYHSADTLIKLGQLGFVVTVIATAFCVWYIFAKLYWNIPMYPIEENSLISSVWAFMTAKWSFHLFIASRSYAQQLNNSFQPLLARGISTSSTIST